MVTFFDRIFETTKYNIKKGDLVLDVGGGNRPFLRSNIVIDKYAKTDCERPYTGSLIKGRYRRLIIGDCLHLPFKDKSIDFLYSRYLIEHISKVETLISEFQRVAKRGVIISPSILSENFGNQYFHCWLIEQKGDRLVFRSKASLIHSPEIDAFVKDVISHKDGGMLMLFRLYYRKFLDSIFIWEDRIKYEVENRPLNILQKEYSAEFNKNKQSDISLIEKIKYNIYEIITFLFFRRKII